jgi:serine/threonine protein kinase
VAEVGTITGAGVRSVGRYQLMNQLENRLGVQLWRGIDTVLGREVAVRLIPLTDVRAEDLRTASCTAATVNDRRLVHILDVINDGGDLAVVSEWMSGKNLVDYLSEPLPPGDATRIALEIGRALETAHAVGIAHGHIRPGCVIISEDGEIRLNGLGIDGVLWGLDNAADGDPVAADIHGVGSILYAGLTCRWPDQATDGLTAAPRVGRYVPPPARVLADVPESLDAICSRTIRTIAPSRDQQRYSSISSTNSALSAALAQLGGPWASTGNFAATAKAGLPRWSRAAIAVVAALSVALAGWILFKPRSHNLPPKPLTSGAINPTSAPLGDLATYRIASAKDFDPFGNGSESPNRVQYAIDDDPESAWRTVTYRNKGLDKLGVGLVVDLGTIRSVSSVDLALVGSGSNVEVRTATDPGLNPEDFSLFARADSAAPEITMRSTKTRNARFVLVWMTRLPAVDGGYRGGIRDIHVRG